LTLKEFDPFFSKGGDMDMNFLAPADRDSALQERGEKAMRASLAQGQDHGYEVGYQTFAINGRMLGHGEPIRVKAGDRVLFHIVNASATEIRSLALPGHRFRVVALDGNALSQPVEVPVLWIGTAERISALVEMKHPGVWVLGDLADDDRDHGMGIVLEYAGHRGKPVWVKPPRFQWDYRLFAPAKTPRSTPDEVIEMTFAKRNAANRGFNRWTINDVAFDMAAMKPLYQLKHGKRYRLRMRNASDDIHPMHLHRHSFEITAIAGRATGGLIKDVVMLGGYQTMDIDFTASQLGLSLFHCHMQLHMDFGFMALFECI
jgi:FtsP/CotA-like multicopper oxidase with cupredoxin domain